MSVAATWLALVALAGTPLTEQGAVEAALREAPALSALEHRVEEARALEGAAAPWDNPELRVENLRSDRLLDPDRRGEPLERARIGLRWDPPRLGEGPARRAAARVATAESAAERELSRRATAARARSLHATVIALDAQLAVAREEREQRERARKLLQRRVELQAATAVEQSAAELDWLEAAAAVQELEARRRHAYDDLLAVTGARAGAVVELSAEGASRCVPPAAGEVLLARAEQGAPRRELFLSELRAVDAERARTWLALVPWPTFVEVSYVLPGDRDPASWTVQLGVELPLLDWRSDERRALEARRRRVEAERRAAEAAAGREVRRALAEVEAKATLAERHREAAAVLEQALQPFERSEDVGALQAAQLRGRLLGARRARLRAELDCTLATIELERLSPLDR